MFTYKQNLSALLSNRLSANHLNKIFEAPPKDYMTSSMSLPLIYSVFSTTQLGISVSSTAKNKSAKKF